MVAFGVHLQRNRAVEWSAHYVRYEVLKSKVSRIKEARERHGRMPAPPPRRRRTGGVRTTDESAEASAADSDTNNKEQHAEEDSSGANDVDTTGDSLDVDVDVDEESKDDHDRPLAVKKPSVVARVRSALEHAIGINIAHDPKVDSDGADSDLDESTASPLRLALRNALKLADRQHAGRMGREQRRLEREFARLIVADAEQVDQWFTQQLAFFMRQFTLLQKQFNTLRAADAAAEQKIRDAHHYSDRSSRSKKSNDLRHRAVGSTSPRPMSVFDRPPTDGSDDAHSSDTLEVEMAFPDRPLNWNATPGELFDPSASASPSPFIGSTSLSPSSSLPPPLELASMGEVLLPPAAIDLARPPLRRAKTAGSVLLSPRPRSASPTQRALDRLSSFQTTPSDEWLARLHVVNDANLAVGLSPSHGRGKSRSNLAFTKRIGSASSSTSKKKSSGGRRTPPPPGRERANSASSAAARSGHHSDPESSASSNNSRPGLLARISTMGEKAGDQFIKSAKSLAVIGDEASHLHENAQLQLRLLKSRTPWRTLRAACKELYRGLLLLKDFKTLNYTAFSKILKKHDKESMFVQMNTVTIRTLDQLSCFSSPQPLTLMVEVEELFTKGFSRGNRKAALAALRPQVPQLSHLVTFRLGLLLGLSICLCIVLFVLIHFVSISSSQTVTDQLMPVLPIYRGLFLVILHLWCWGANVYLFHEKRINYMFIFEIDPRTELQHPQVLQIAALLTFGWFLSLDLYVSTTLLAAYWPNLQNGYFHMVLYLVILLIVICPFDYFARATRIYVARTLGAILTTGLGPVAFKDFYTCNQLCSLVNVFNDLSYGLCYYATGDFLTDSAKRCKSFQSDAVWVIAFIPYFFRFIQCLKRYYDSKAKRQLYNAGKYSLSLLTTFWSVMHKHYPDDFLPQWIICAIMSTTASYSWDVKCDWGLLEFHPDVKKDAESTKEQSKHWLRRFLPSWFPHTDSILRRRRVLDWSGWYFWAIISDAAMRLAWVATISPDVMTGGAIPVDYFKSIIYAVEVIRRNQW